MLKRVSLFFVVATVCLLAAAAALRAQGGPGNPEAQARQKQQLALEASTPKLQITEEVLPLTVPTIQLVIDPFLL